MTTADLDKTALRRIEQYRDRWSSYGAQTGLLELSDYPSVTQLQEIELFAGLDGRFLEKIASDVSIARWQEGAVLFEQGSYIDLAFYVLEGEVEVYLEGEGSEGLPRPIFDLERTAMGPEPAAGDRPPDATMMMRQATRPSAHEITMLATMSFDLPRGAAVRLGPGELFGEIGAMSGWPQSVTARLAKDSRLVQVRLPALRMLKRKSKALKERLDRLYRERSLADQLKRTPLFSRARGLVVEAMLDAVELVSCDPGETIVSEGDPADALYMVRSGFVKLLQGYGEDEMAVSYLSKGMTLGEVEYLVDDLDGWQVTATSVEYAELVRLPRVALDSLLDSHPETARRLWDSAAERIREAGYTRRNLDHSEFIQLALDRGLVQGSSVLAIDLERCTRCDDCVRACEATHGGRARFVREGDRVQNLLIPRSCYHCRDPVCLVGCPTGAIHRAGVGEVVAVDEKICIGCGSCERNCPYDAIVMHDTGSVWPDDMVPTGLRGRDRAVASKCDLCESTGHGPACVSNCPQGCAYRVGSVEEMQALLGGGRR